MPGLVHERSFIAWNEQDAQPCPRREREEHAYRWRRLPDRPKCWVGEERARAAGEAAASERAQLVHDLRHLLTRAELEWELGEPARARAALAQARGYCEEALGLRAPQQVDLVRVCSEEARAAALAQMGRQLQSSLPRECSLVCGESALRRLLANLLGNALRATPQGQTVRLELAGEADGGARLTITDRGPGLARGEIDSRLATRSSGSGSTGLGSLSVLECARSLRATIRVASEPGVGCEFEVRIPGLA
ncbi:MAG: sensor histidine kinase [Planctomycetes bacterium]|nr:sensor histidine kinase [Planctomycetota bacterium]